MLLSRFAIITKTKWDCCFQPCFGYDELFIWVQRKTKRKQIRPMSNTHVWIYCYTTKGFIGEAISKAGLIAELMFDVMRRKDSLLPSPLTKHNIKGIDHSGYECETSF